MDDFYVMLHSQGCSLIHPHNAPHDFKNTFTKEIDLRAREEEETSWEMALVELIHDTQQTDALSFSSLSLTIEQADPYLHREDHFSFEEAVKYPYPKITIPADRSLFIEHFSWTIRRKRDGKRMFRLYYNHSYERFFLKTFSQGGDDFLPRLQLPMEYLIQMGFRKPLPEVFQGVEKRDYFADVLPFYPEDGLGMAPFPPERTFIYLHDAPLLLVAHIGRREVFSHKIILPPSRDYSSSLDYLLKRIHEGLKASINMRKEETHSKHEDSLDPHGRPPDPSLVIPPMEVWGDDPTLFAVNPITGRIHLTLPTVCAVTFHGGLHTLLGFSRKHYKRNHVAEHLPFGRGRTNDTIYVLCNLIPPQRIANVYLPLLRQISAHHPPTANSFTHNFERLRYLPLQRLKWDMIEIRLVNENGDPLPVEDSRKTLAWVHFRPRTP